jgi:CheY-like chemotaxis protein
VMLPIDQTDERDSVSGKLAVRAETMALKLRHILIVEDNEDHLALTIEALEDAGVSNPVMTASGVQEARAILAQCAEEARAGKDGLPCVILLDVRLPDGSGMELLSEIKEHAILRSVPVVVLTSSDDTPDIRKAYQLGANSYLVKPVVFDEFHRKVREAGIYWALLNHLYDP